MKKLLQTYQDGTCYMESTDYQEITNIIQENEIECHTILYRGLKLAGDEMPEVGETFKFKNYFESFSEDIDIALEFTLDHFPVIVRLIDSYGLPLYEYTENDTQLEWLIMDKDYVISSIEYNEDDEYYIIDIEEV